MIEWNFVIVLMIGAFGFGYGLACRHARKDLEAIDEALTSLEKKI